MARAKQSKKASVSSRTKKQNLWTKIRDYSFGQSRAYLLEYGLLLVLVLSLVGVLTTMIDSVIMAIGDEMVLNQAFGNVEYPFGVGLVAYSLVVLPLVVVLFCRTRESEFVDSRVKNLGWRKAFLGIFLAIVVLAAVAAAVGTTYEIASWVANIGLGPHLFDWRSFVSGVLSVIALGATGWLFGYDYRNAPTRYASWQRVYRYALVGVSILVTLVFILVALREQRNSYVDEKIATDLRSIRMAIDNQVSSRGSLPGDLSDISLTSEQKRNAKAYHYEYSQSRRDNTYKLCANFKTDTRNEVPVQSPFMPLGFPLSGMSPMMYPPYGDNDPGNHNNGRYCFTYNSVSYYAEPAASGTSTTPLDLPMMSY